VNESLKVGGICRLAMFQRFDYLIYGWVFESVFTTLTYVV